MLWVGEHRQIVNYPDVHDTAGSMSRTQLQQGRCMDNLAMLLHLYRSP